MTRYSAPLALFLAAAAVAQPQTKPGQPGASPAAVTPPAGAVEFAETPFRIHSIGLTMYLPAGAAAQTSGSGTKVSAQIVARDSTWLVNLQAPQTSNLQTDTNTVATEVLNQLLASVGIPERKIVDGKIVERVLSTKATIVEPVKALVIPTENPQDQRPASRFYVRLPRGEGELGVIRGYTVFQVAPGRFVTFDMTTPEDSFAKARPLYEAMIAKARFADPEALAAARGQMIDSGMELLTRLTPSDYEAACATQRDQWYRLYQPAPGGADADAKEIGYRRVRAAKDFRGELDPKRPESKWSAADRQEGYVVRIDARVLEGDLIIDSVGVYFMTPDRREEAWTLQTVIKDPKARKPVTWTEVGGRLEGKMTVMTDGSQESKGAQPMVPDLGYLNQVESFLLPQLLIQHRRADAKGREGEYGFYSYQSEFGNVRLRRDTLGEAQDRAGAWLLTTQMNEDRPAQVSIYNERGELIQTKLANGNIWVPIQLDRLAELWRSKGHPMN